MFANVTNAEAEVNYKSLDDYIAQSEIKLENHSYTIDPVIQNVKKVYIDLTKSTEETQYCYIWIKNAENSKSIDFSSRNLNETSQRNMYVHENDNSVRYIIKKAVDEKTFSWLYYNPDNLNEVIIDVEECFGCVGYISSWQMNFGTSCVVNIITNDTYDTIDVSVSSSTSNKEIPISILLNNKTTDFTAFQFDLVLPSGFVLAERSYNNFKVSLTDRYEDFNQNLSVSRINDDTYRFICFSTSNGIIKGNSGAIIDAFLSVVDESKIDNYEATITNIVLTKKDGKEVKLSDIKFIVYSTLKGDANGDGLVNVSDIVEIVNYIMGKSSRRFSTEAADMNEDNIINVTDIVQVVSLIMSSGDNRTRGVDNNKPENNEYSLNKTKAVGKTRTINFDIDNIEISPNTSKQVQINLQNPDVRFSAFQFDLVLPEGISIDKSENGNLLASLNNERIDDHTLSVSDLGSNTYRFLSFSMTSADFKDQEGPLIYLTIKVDADESNNTKTASIKNQVFTTADGDQIYNEDFNFSIIVKDGAGIIKPNTESKTYDIFDLNGRKIKSKVKTTEGLSKGIYIINKKKNIVY